VFKSWSGAEGLAVNPLAASTAVRVDTPGLAVSSRWAAASDIVREVVVAGAQHHALEGDVLDLLADNSDGSFLMWSGQVDRVGDMFAARTTLTTPGFDCWVTPLFRSLPIPPGTFELTVVNGTGSGTHSTADNVAVTAGNPPAGMGFSHWWPSYNLITGSLSPYHEPSMFFPRDSFSDGAQVTVTAMYKPVPPRYFELKVFDGSGSGVYKAGTPVAVAADQAPAGHVFESWGGDGTTNQEQVPSFTFTMPRNDVGLYANYRDARLCECLNGSLQLSDAGAMTIEQAAGCRRRITAAGLGTIGAEAFMGCTLLTTISTRYSPSIGADAFQGAPSTPLDMFLWEGAAMITGLRPGIDLAGRILTIPAGAGLIGAGAFAGAAMTGVVFLSTGIVDIGDEAFKGCVNLLTVTGTGLGVVGARAFMGCSALSGVGCPVGTPGPDSFRGCSSLTSALVAGAYIHERAFMGCSALTSITTGALTSIGEYAFYKSGLTGMDLSAGCSGIGAGAFTGSAIASLDVPEGCEMDPAAVNACLLLQHVTLPSDQALARAMFSHLSELLTITIGHSTCSVAAIPADFANGCVKLTSVVLTNCSNAVAVGARAFTGCPQLTAVTAGPDGFSAVGDYAFQGCAKLAGLPSSAGVAAGAHAFDGCSLLYSVGPLTAVGSYAFNACAALQTVSFTAACSNISDHAFANSRLTSLALPDTVTSIGSEALIGCGYLQTFNTGNGITALPQDLFNTLASTQMAYNQDGQNWGLGSLHTLVIGDGVTEIPRDMFSHCGNLASLTFGASVNRIGYNAFGYCTGYGATNTCTPDTPGLKVVTLPASMRIVEGMAFIWCSQLNTLNLNAGLQTLADGAFYGCGYLVYSPSPWTGQPMGLTAVTVPAGCSDQGAFGACPTTSITYL
jgi:hypothetical protein